MFVCQLGVAVYFVREVRSSIKILLGAVNSVGSGKGGSEFAQSTTNRFKNSAKWLFRSALCMLSCKWRLFYS